MRARALEREARDTMARRGGRPARRAGGRPHARLLAAAALAALLATGARCWLTAAPRGRAAATPGGSEAVAGGGCAAARAGGAAPRGGAAAAAAVGGGAEGGGEERRALKQRLLGLLEGTARGAEMGAGVKEEIVGAFEALERLNPSEAPLQDPLLRAEWELLWTTSSGILGSGRPWLFRPRASKPILQFLDPAEGVARNLEYTRLGNNRVEATITPLDPAKREEFTSRLDDYLVFKYGANESKGGTYMPDSANLEKNTVAVRFRKFVLFGWLPLNAPETATGILEITYLDDELRLSRGDRGNLFVLRRLSDERIA